MEFKINIPTSLKDITLKQYKKFLKIQDGIENTTFLQLKIIEIFCDVDFIMNGEKYGFVPDLDNMTLGEYIDLDTYSSDYENIEIAMNVLYRPVTTKLKNKYLIVDYNPDTKDKMLNMPMDAVISSMFFFLNLRIELSNIILNSSEAREIAQQVEWDNFQSNMDGISRFLPYLKETLNELNISLN